MFETARAVDIRIDAHGKTAREINQAIKKFIAAGEKAICVRNVQAQHNLAVGTVTPVSIFFEGSVGYYCGGLIDGPTLSIEGSAGWGLGESMMSGTIRVKGHAGNSCAASMRGGVIVVHGNVASRAATSMKGGLLIVEGNCDYMAGFMMQKGTIIVCGNAGPALADSMYEGCIYVGGEIQELGNDAVIRELTDSDWKFLQESLDPWGLSVNRSFKKVVAGRRLWNFDKQEMDIWKEAL